MKHKPNERGWCDHCYMRNRRRAVRQRVVRAMTGYAAPCYTTEQYEQMILMALGHSSLTTQDITNVIERKARPLLHILRREGKVTCHVGAQQHRNGELQAHLIWGLV